jgi:hypothetical protein
VGNRTIDIGNKTPPGKPGQPKVESLVGNDVCSEPRIDPTKSERPKICGAMSQQRGDSGRGNESVPQKLVQLVGCRDRKP